MKTPGYLITFNEIQYMNHILDAIASDSIEIHRLKNYIYELTRTLIRERRLYEYKLLQEVE